MLTLLELQDKVKRDKDSYAEEFHRVWHQWESLLPILASNPPDASGIIGFLSHTHSYYKKNFPEQVASLLSSPTQIPHDLVLSLVKALILMRNKSNIPIESTLPLFFSLFSLHNKQVKADIFSHLISDISKQNRNHKNNTLNRITQNFMYQALASDSAISSKNALLLMIKLYHKKVWNDSKTVNVISTGTFSENCTLARISIHFLLGNISNIQEEEDEEEINIDFIKHRLQINKKKGSKATLVEKAMSKIKKKQRQKDESESSDFSALQLLNSPQDFAEKIYSLITNNTTTTQKYEVRLLRTNLLSRLIGIHKLHIPQFYTYLAPLLQPRMKNVHLLLAYTAQSAHSLVVPEDIGTCVTAISNGFLWGNQGPEVVTAGLNALREICKRCPLAMSSELLDMLIEDFRRHKDRATVMASRSLVTLYRDIEPGMLRKKHRGRAGQMNLTELKRKGYGEVDVLETIEGADLLLQEELEASALLNDNSGTIKDENTVAENVIESIDKNPGEGWDEWEVASDDDASDHSDNEESGDDIGSDSDVNEIEGDEDDVDKSKIGPKELKLREQRAKRQKLADPAISEEIKRRVIQSASERIYTDEDFAKMRELAANRKAEAMAGIKQTHVKLIMEENDLEEEGGDLGDTVDPKRITSGIKRKQTYQDRINSILEGREGRETYGSRKGKKDKDSSTTNREKQKKTKAFMMIAHKRSVKCKATRSLREKQKILRNHITKQKKKGH